jgi:hypothetical protein
MLQQGIEGQTTTRRLQYMKLVISLLLLCVMALTQVSAFSAQNESHRPGEHCCMLCHVGPLQLLDTRVLMPEAPVLHVEWLPSHVSFESRSDFRLVRRPSRAPPIV